MHWILTPVTQLKLGVNPERVEIILLYGYGPWAVILINVGLAFLLNQEIKIKYVEEL